MSTDHQLPTDCHLGRRAIARRIVVRRRTIRGMLDLCVSLIIAPGGAVVGHFAISEAQTQL